MTIKLTHKQLEGIYLIVNYLLSKNESSNIAESLLNEIVFKVKEKMRAKVVRKEFDNRVGSNLSLTSIEAKALYVWYNQTVSLCSEEIWRYEINTGSIVMNQIDKVYA